MPVPRERRIQPIGSELIVNQRCVFLQRLIRREGRRQLLVVTVDEIDGLFSGRFVNGGNCRDDIADVAHLFAGEDLLILNREAESLARHITRRKNRQDARQCARPARVEPPDLGVGYGTPKELGVEHRRQDDIHRIGSAPRDGLRAVQARVRLADNFEMFHAADRYLGGA